MTTVSVCIPSFNSEKYIKQTIESVLCQSFKSYEIIIVDDNSSDNTRQIIATYAKNYNKIKFYTNDSNLGIVGNFNKCLSLSQGKYIKFLLADDLLLDPDSLTRFVDVIERHPNVSLVSSGRTFIDSNSKIIGNAVCYQEGIYSPGNKIIEDCLLSLKNKIGEPTSVIFKKDSLKRGFDCNYKQLLDLEMWFYLLENGEFYYISDTLVGFRKHEEQATQKHKINLDYLNDFPNLLNDYCSKPYITCGKFIRTMGMVRHGDKLYKLYKNGRLSFLEMKTMLNHHFSFLKFLLFRPFYKFLKNILRLQFLR